MYTLTAWDYLIIACMLFTSAGIGVFFAIRSRRNQTSNDYFLGNSHMSVVPVSLSLSATVMSAITYLGTPAEVYINGPKFGLIVVTRTLAAFVVMYCFVPVYYRLKVTTMYEYLEMRFNNTVRYLVIACKLLFEFTYMGIVVYAPSLALSTVTGVNLSLAIVTVGAVCTFYTSIGGIKAVIWTDVFQAFSMILGAGVMIVGGTVSIGGPNEGWRRAVEGGRGQLVDFNLDPTLRMTFWSVMIGGFTLQLVIGGTKQSLVQRYNSCRNEQEAMASSWLGLFGMSVIDLLAVATGMTVFAFYSTCDPLTSGKINRPDQIVPYYMMDVFGSYPGLPGILIGGAFCASLSSLSSVLNGLAATTGQDIIKTIWPNIPEKKYSIIVKVISAVYGLVTILLAFLASVLGDVLQSALSIGGLTGGPVLGVFILGIFVPRSNSKGAVTGLLGGVMIGLVIYVGSQIYPPVNDKPPLSTAGCLSHFVNETALQGSAIMSTVAAFTQSDFSAGNTTPPMPPITKLFGLSYLYLSTVTSLTTTILGIAVSYVTSCREPVIADPKLLAPFIAGYYTKVGKNEKHSDYKEYMALKKV